MSLNGYSNRYFICALGPSLFSCSLLSPSFCLNQWINIISPFFLFSFLFFFFLAAFSVSFLFFSFFFLYFVASVVSLSEFVSLSGHDDDDDDDDDDDVVAVAVAVVVAALFYGGKEWGRV